MSLLEGRYRYALRLLPASYRAEREEEMVCAFLEGAGDLHDEDNPRPRWSEIASVAALSVRVRLGGVGAAPRFFAWGQAVRLVAVLGLSFHATMSCVWLANTLKFHGFFGAPSGDYQTALGSAGSAERLRDIAQVLTYLLWIAAAASLVRGRPRAAKTTALLALALSYGPVIQSGNVLWNGGTKSVVLHSVLFVVPMLALPAGFHRDAPRNRHPWWVAALPVGAGTLLYVILNVLGSASMAQTVNWQFWSWIWPWLGESGLACLALLAASVSLVGTHLWAPARRTPSLPLALAILAVPVMLTHVFSLTFDAIDPATRTMAVVNVGQLIALLLSALTLIVLTAKTMPPRRVRPQPTPEPTAPGDDTGLPLPEDQD
ncbi:hypothetical protein GCM10017673_34760 [Streptosporangium violaceochromogenes]|nr:hypothetical protein GCM10017673_34760 [Streptosporangium violaceochromogenes]